MPRKPTGRPRGRPAGTGQLDNPKRITVWLRGETYARLENYADGRHYHRGEPQLASCMRELLEHALACPYKQQTQNIPVLHGDTNRQRESVPPAAQNNYEQLETIAAVPENNYYEQIENAPRVSAPDNGQIENDAATTQLPRRRTKARATVLQEAQTPALAEDTPGHSADVPAYDTTRFYLGKLCPKGHDYDGTGQSLLRKHNQGCRDCENAGKKARRQAKRQALSSPAD